MMFKTQDVPLFMAVSEGRLDVKQALEQGADVHATDHCGDPSHGNIYYHMNIINELLKRGAYPHRKYGAGSSLEYAIKLRSMDLIKDFSRHGAEIDVWRHGAEIDCGHSLLHFAVMTGDLAFVETLLKAGADVNIQNNSGAGIDCLSLSLEQGELSIIQALLKHGADTSNIDKFFLARAIVTGHRDVIRELLKHGVEFSEVLPYHLTVLNQDIDMALEFFKHGVSICTKGRNCETVFDSIFASAVHLNSDILTAEYPIQLIKYAVLVNFANDPSVVMESKNDDAFIEHFYEHYCRLLSCFFICEAELKEMSSFRVNESFTLYDVTLEAFLGYKSKPVEYGQDILNQILILLKQSKFPVYEECVISAVNKAQLVHKLMEYQVSLKEPNCDTKGKLLVPINVIDNVGDYLSNKDLINWLWAMKDL